MLIFSAEITLARPIEEVFDFFRRPANRVELAPPDLDLRLAEAPIQIELGSRVVVKVRRWGLRQTLTAEVIGFEPPTRIVEEQRGGPFRRWVHSHTFSATGEGTRLVESIDYEPPGGALGLLMTAAVIESELRRLYDYRRQRLRERFGGPD